MSHPITEPHFVEAASGDGPTPFPGITTRPLFVEEGKGVHACELAFKAGALFPDHGHPAGEYLLMLEGHLQIGERCLGPGDFLYTPPGAWHRATAVTDCRCFLLVPSPVTFSPEGW